MIALHKRVVGKGLRKYLFAVLAMPFVVVLFDDLSLPSPHAW
jgi:hypothetical protein